MNKPARAKVETHVGAIKAGASRRRVAPILVKEVQKGRVGAGGQDGASRQSRGKMGIQVQATQAGPSFDSPNLQRTSHLLSVDLGHQQAGHRPSPKSKAEHIGHSASKGNGASA